MTLRARVLLFAMSAILTVTATLTAHAQGWPNRPLRIIVGFPPGGVADAIPRKLQQTLGDALKTSIVIENKPGGAGLIAMDAIAKGDDHTVGIMTLQNLTVAAVRDTMPYDPRKDLQGVVVFGRTASVLVVTDELPVK